MNDQLRTRNKGEKFLRNLREFWLVRQIFQLDAMYSGGSLINFPFRMNPLIEVVSCKTTVDHLHAGDFNDAMAQGRIESGRFCVEDNLTTQFVPLTDCAKTRSTPRLASTSARSFSA